MAGLGSLVSLLCTAVALSSAPAASAVAYPKASKSPAIKRQTVTSTAHCDVTAGTALTKESAAVVTTFASEVSVFICDPSKEDTEQLIAARGNAVAAAQAEGFARAVASIAVDCSLSGTTSVKIDGRSVAMAQATLMATALVEAVARAEVCGGCKAEATLSARRTSEAILAAIAIAEVEISEVSSGGDRKLVIDEFVESVVEGTTQALGQLLTTAAASLDGSCQASIQLAGTTDGNINDDLPADAFGCELASVGTSASFVRNATANATQTVRAAGCETPSHLQAAALAQEVATATAAVLAFQTQQCDVGDGGSACSFLSLNITSTATAFAEAVAKGVAEAVSTCHPPLCEARVRAVEHEVADIFVNVTETLVSNLCTGGDGTFERSELVSRAETESVVAFASAFAEAMVRSDKCNPTAEANATVTPTPDGPVPRFDLDAPELPPVPGVGGPDADDPGTATNRSFTNRDAEDTILLQPPLADGPSGIEIQASANTVSGTNVTFSEACDSGDCAGNFRQCAGIVDGEKIAPLTCCSKGFECAQKSESFGLCVRLKSKLVRDGEATVVASNCGH